MENDSSKKIEISKIRAQFDEILIKHITRLLEVNSLTASLSFNLSTISCLLLIVERENEIRSFPDSPPERYTKETFLVDLADLGLQIDDDLMKAFQRLAEIGYVEIGTDGKYFAQISTFAVVSFLNNLFPGMSGMHFVAYMVQTIDEVISERKKLEDAIDHFDQTLMARGIPLSKQKIESVEKEAVKSKPIAVRRKIEPKKITDDLKQTYLQRLSKLRNESESDALTPSVLTRGHSTKIKIKELFHKRLDDENEEQNFDIEKESLIINKKEEPVLKEEPIILKKEEPVLKEEPILKKEEPVLKEEPILKKEEPVLKEGSTKTAPLKTENRTEQFEQKQPIESKQEELHKKELKKESEPDLKKKKKIEEIEEEEEEEDNEEIKEEFNIENETKSLREEIEEHDAKNISIKKKLDISDDEIERQIEAFEEEQTIICPICNEGRIKSDKTSKGKMYYSCSNENCRFISWGKPYPFLCPLCKNLFLVEFSDPNGNFGLKCMRATCSYRQNDLYDPAIKKTSLPLSSPNVIQSNVQPNDATKKKKKVVRVRRKH